MEAEETLRVTINEVVESISEEEVIVELEELRFHLGIMFSMMSK